MTAGSSVRTATRGPRIASSIALATLSVVLVLGIGGGNASAADGKPDCHGQNQVDCRPDPQPDHGRDCEKSDDHRCLDTSTTTTQPPTTTTTIPEIPTTTTTLPAESPSSSTTSTTTAPPTTTTAPTPAASGAENVPPTRPVSLAELPRTGSGAIPYLAVAGLALILVGSYLWTVNR